jgi:hypothetical protein
LGAQNPEAAKASDEEYQEAHCPPVVGSISERNTKYAKVLQSRMADGCLIATWILLTLRRCSEGRKPGSSESCDEGYRRLTGISHGCYVNSEKRTR